MSYRAVLVLSHALAFLAGAIAMRPCTGRLGGTDEPPLPVTRNTGRVERKEPSHPSSSKIDLRVATLPASEVSDAWRAVPSEFQAGALEQRLGPALDECRAKHGVESVLDCSAPPCLVALLGPDPDVNMLQVCGFDRVFYPDLPLSEFDMHGFSAYEPGTSAKSHRGIINAVAPTGAAAAWFEDEAVARREVNLRMHALALDVFDADP